MIPDEILQEIVSRARSDWPKDKDMQKHCISAEKEGFEKLQNLDFGGLSDRRDETINAAKDIFTGWDEIYNEVESEVLAHRKILGFSVEGIEQDIIDDWKALAENDHEGNFTGQLDYLETKAAQYASILETRQQIDPIKKLLIELEQIIGNECYNGNIQNYGSWGELDSIGRKFRYPVKYYSDKNEKKTWNVPADIPSEDLITGHYAFGANELSIYRALYKVVSHLRAKYGLKV